MSSKNPARASVKRCSPKISKPWWRLGNKELSQLWKWADQNPNALTDPQCVRTPSITEYWKPLAEDIDDSSGIEAEYHHKNNRVYCWKGLRFSARQDLEGFSRFTDHGIEGVVPPELLPPEICSKFHAKPTEKNKRAKKEDESKGTPAQLADNQAKCTTLIKNRSSEEPIHGRIQPHCNNLSFEDEREFSYQSGSKNGPEHWGEIHEDWSICGKGKMQSPIDLSHDRVQVVHHLGRLRRTYRPANAVMLNRGHDIMLKWEEEAGGVILNGTEYQIKQLHWHAPSEHSINGRRYDLELHMVHESADKKITVIGIMYKLGRPDTLLAKMEDYVRKLEDIKDGEEKVGMVNPREVKWGSRKYYRYMGSLTTPPCTEGVIWHIINKVRTVSKEQLHMLREAVHDESEMNARPEQEVHDRVINMYRPRKVQY